MAQGPISVLAANSSALGRSLFVNETLGADTNNGSAQAPFATLDAALAAARSNRGDTVYLVGTSHRTATLNWNKDGVSLVGITAPSDNARARISISGSTVFTPLVNVTGVGCSFVNIGTFHGFNNASAQICWAEAGGRNFYSGVQFLGLGNATAAAQTGGRSLTIAGSGENLFQGCTFGLDTIARGVANATLELLGGTPRNVIRKGIFQMLSSASTPLHITVGSAAMDRFLYLDDCALINAIESTGVSLTAAIVANASAGGAVLLRNPLVLGAAAIATTGPVYIVGSTPAATTSGIAIKAT